MTGVEDENKLSRRPLVAKFEPVSKSQRSKQEKTERRMTDLLTLVVTTRAAENESIFVICDAHILMVLSDFVYIQLDHRDRSINTEIVV